MTYAVARRTTEIGTEIGHLLRHSTYAVRELGGVTTVNAHARQAHYELFGSHAVSVRRTMLEEHLSRLHRQWNADTRHLSSLAAKKAHPAYSTIVALGEEAIPPILEALEERPDLLVMALHDITGEDPVAPEHHGRLPQIVEDWLRWGTEHGHRP